MAILRCRGDLSKVAIVVHVAAVNEHAEGHQTREVEIAA